MSRLVAAHGRLTASSFIASKPAPTGAWCFSAFLQAKKKTLKFKVFF